jgi:hypothetical protein
MEKEAVFIARFSTVAPLNSKTGVFWTSKIYGFGSSMNLYSYFALGKPSISCNSYSSQIKKQVKWISSKNLQIKWQGIIMMNPYFHVS